MKKKFDVKVNIKNPCSEDWDSMIGTSNGRYCSKCSSNVVDMTTWSNDDFINYFNSNPQSLCGRLSANQINKTFIANNFILKKKFKYERTLAFLMSILSFQNISAQNHETKKFETETLASSDPEKIIISGIITDENLKPIHKAYILFNNEEYFSDSVGYFEIVLSSDGIQNGILIFGYQDHELNHRIYNASMKSTVYNVRLQSPKENIMTKLPLDSLKKMMFVTGRVDSKIFRYPLNNGEDFVTISTNQIDFKTRKSIDEYGRFLRNAPEFAIELQPYTLNNKIISFKKAELVKNYLIEKCGIEKERIIVLEPKLSRIPEENDRICIQILD